MGCTSSGVQVTTAEPSLPIGVPTAINAISEFQGGNKADCYTGNGIIINSGKFNGLDNQKFKKIVCDILEETEAGEKTINYKLRDWIFTRQRYWGEPIPIMFDGKIKIPNILKNQSQGFKNKRAYKSNIFKVLQCPKKR